MANHWAQAQFDRAGWRLALLGPLWALQLALALSTMGLFSWRLGDTLKHDGWRRASVVAAALAVYAVLAYRRLRVYDDYARPANVRGYGFSDAARLRSGFVDSRRPSMASLTACSVQHGHSLGLS